MGLRPPHLGHVHVRRSEGLVQGGVGHHEVHPDPQREEEVSFDVRNPRCAQAFAGEREFELNITFPILGRAKMKTMLCSVIRLGL